MEVLIISLIVVSAVCGVAVVVGGEVLFRRSPCGQLWLAMRGEEKQLRCVVRDVGRRLGEAKGELANVAAQYENAYVDDQLRRRPIRDLRSYISVSMSWAALERAGIDNVAQFLAFRGDFRRIHGIGDARASALVGARQRVAAEVQGMTVPMPGVSRPGTLEFQTVTALIKVVRGQQAVAPGLEELNQHLQNIRDQRPAAIAVRWRCLVGGEAGRRELVEVLRELHSELEELSRGQVQSLLDSLEEAQRVPASVEELSAQYAESEGRAKGILDQVTARRLRGTLRPFGLAALRAGEGFENEEDFCDRVLEPFVAKLGYDHVREFSMERRVGSRSRTMYVDFLLLDDHGRRVGVLEAKHSIRNDRELDDAREQAKSYATFKELVPCLVAAKEGLWIYERRGQRLTAHGSYSMEEAFEKTREIRQIIENIR